MAVSVGDENCHFYGVVLGRKGGRYYTPFPGARADFGGIERSQPDTLLVQVNARDRRLFDVWRLTLSTGALALDTKNPGDVAGWVADRNLNVRAAQIGTPDGGNEIRLLDNRTWKPMMKTGPEEILSAI